uniref:Uncharacterized protein n=1 Tax=Anguilla anguilla TaxID=7936 RepID=A0A0E9QZP3_ANGAN
MPWCFCPIRDIGDQNNTGCTGLHSSPHPLSVL